MGVIVRMYGLDILTSIVGTSINKFAFKDEQQALWAIHMATELLKLHHCMKFAVLTVQSTTRCTVDVSVREHAPGDGPSRFNHKGFMMRLEYQTNLKHLFEEVAHSGDADGV